MTQADIRILGEPLTWPDIAFPLTTTLHPGAELAAGHCADWARRTGLVQTDTALNVLVDSRLELLGARIYPGADQDTVDLVTDWLAWICVFDDHCDEGELRQDSALARSVFDELLSVLTEDCAPVRTTTTLSHALADLWRRTAPGMSPQWRRRFKDCTGRVLATMEREMARHALGSVPTEEELAERVGGTLNRTATEAWFACAQLELPDRLFGTAAQPGPAEHLMRITEEVVVWCNDILSLEKDLAWRDQSNLVIFIHEARGCSWQDAVDALHGRINDHLAEFGRVADQLAEAMGADLADVADRACVTAMNHMCGSVDWSKQTGRYRRVQSSEPGTTARYLDSLTPPDQDKTRATNGHLQQAERALRGEVDRLPAPLRDIAGYHFGWMTTDGAPASHPAGKKLRPALAMCVAEALGASPDTALPGAIAVDLIHNQSLIHDDIIDADPLRRHRPAVWAAFGTPEAILAGDAVLTLGFQAVLGGPLAARAVGQLGDSFQYMLYGQMLDSAFEQRAEVSTNDYVTMARAKTGSLFGCAAGLGAIYAQATDDAVATLDTFGQYLGAAFQLVDDILGIWGDPQTVGKPVGTDLQRRKKSGPVVAALTAAGPGGDQLRELYAQDAPFAPADLQDIAGLIEQAGGRSWAQRTAEHYMTLATQSLDDIPLTPTGRKALEQFISGSGFSVTRSA
ncbi:polyprenyl synthetase family protein [Saccharopolyspora pogona]|uniref:polyprenyl synthetase family protein n=1 Tax=Saccharopolyspora pogona TaxID=333966 RepID=UPI001688E5A9|nr:polyprenyl synthetase family protein [Saccharopolyspora pogona]